MSDTGPVVVKHEGTDLRLRFDACRIALGGEFGGNVDVDVTCDAGAVDALLEHLEVALPGGARSGPAIATGERSGGVTLCFWIESILRLSATPDHVELCFAGAAVARLAAALDESLPLEQAIRLLDPAEMGTTPTAVHHENLVPLAVSYEKWWYLLVAAAVALGWLGASALSICGSPHPGLLALGAGAVLGVAGLGTYLARTAYRQVWLDRDRRRVLVVEGRAREIAVRLAQAPGRSLDEFDHVRLYMRWQLAHGADGVDQEVWFVTLEGPISHAGSDGRVHLHPDALPLGEMRGESAARQLAADAARLTGLRILDTGHDATA